ncbi:MAG: hypothetical protein KJO26_01930 [Deltaproteobacteria bacterium]|nr:hypothetical protein [Deltaproteobacteria bacterium]NNK85004.1 hypothetical protein [Desulfobacterales bacterium]
MISAKIKHFKLWVFWTGVFNIISYTALTCPFTLEKFMATTNSLSRLFGLGGSPLSLPVNSGNLMMINLFGFFIIVLGILLIIASFDIQNRSWYVFWEGVIRVFAFLYILYFVLLKDAAQILFLFGTIDLVIAFIYFYYIFSIKEIRIT